MKTKTTLEPKSKKVPKNNENQVPEVVNQNNMNFKEVEVNVIRLMEEAHRAIKNLSETRLKMKLSNSRVSGVARELKELIKVMNVYL